MASKFGLAGGIPERRVRPIWDAVDSRQYKAALKLSASLLQKYPKSPYALALKALILERMTKSDEALNACLNAKQLLESDNAPFLDDLTLSTLQIVFQRLDRLDLGTSCYEHACTKYLNNLEIMMGLFNCHVREYSYVKQQQTAMKMYKAVGEERFLLWAVCSIQLQVLFTTGGEKLLPLAEALMKKHINSHSLHEPEALTIYISILEQQGKNESALELINGDLGSLIGREEDKLCLQGRLLSRSCNYSAASEIFQKVLESSPDDWESFLHFLACLLEEDIDWSNKSNLSIIKESKLSEEVYNSRLSSALSLVEKLQKDAIKNCTRGPYLFNIEIKRLQLNNKSDTKFIDSLLNYFNRFGYLACFASDVEKYLNFLKENERNDLLERINEPCIDSKIHSLGRQITIFKIQEIIGSMWKKSTQELEIDISKKVELFCKNLALSKELDPQENMHGEELLVMASNTLVMLFWRTRNLRYLLEAILVLEFGLTIRRYTWQYKIPLLHIYSYLNALPLACDWYRTLDVKNILLETLSHHILPQTLISPLLNEANEFSKDYLKFIDDHLKESADLTCLAYRHRNYSKAIEFVRFKERLENSSQYLMTKLDSFILDLKSKSNNLDDFQCVLGGMNNGMKSLELVKENKLKQLTTNGDLQSRPWWSPTSTINYLSIPFDEESATTCFGAKLEKNSENNITQEIPLFERKALVPKLVHLSIQSASLNNNNNNNHAESANGAISNINIVGELGTLLEKYARTIGLSFNDAIHAILSISTGQKSFQDFPCDIVSCISFAVFINAWNCSLNDISNKDLDHKLINWEIVDQLVKITLKEKLNNLGPALTSPGNEIPVLAQIITGPLSWHILIIQSYLKSIFPMGKKKKKNEKLNVNIIPQLKIVQGSINCLMDSIGDTHKWILNQVNKSEDNDLDLLNGYLNEGGDLNILNVLKDGLESIEKFEVGERIYEKVKSFSCGFVVRKLVGAQRKMLNEFGLICENKLKVLQSLKQMV